MMGKKQIPQQKTCFQQAQMTNSLLSEPLLFHLGLGRHDSGISRRHHRRPFSCVIAVAFADAENEVLSTVPIVGVNQSKPHI